MDIIIQTPEFSGGNVPTEVAAKVMKKSVQFIRVGMQKGILDFGYAVKNEGSSQYTYYISPLKFWQATGYIYRGE